MANKNQVTITIAGDADSLDRALRRAAGSLNVFDTRVDGSERKMGSFGSSIASFAKTAAFGLAGVGVAAAGLGAIAVNMGMDFVNAAEESRKATKQTAAVIKSMGNVANVSAEQVADLSEALSKKTGIDDELIQSGQNVLLTFANIRNEVGEGNRIFDRATTAALDMSVALGQDLQSSVTQVGKALNDPIAGISALSRVGVQFTEDQKNLIKTLVESGDTLGAQKIILEELERQFTGSAEAQATASDKLRVAWGNLQEKLGEQLLPLFEQFATWLTETGIPKLEELATKIQEKVAPAIADLKVWVQDTLLPALQELWAYLQENVIPIWEETATTIRDDLLPQLGDLVTNIGDLFSALTGVNSKSDESKSKAEQYGEAIKRVSDAIRIYTEFQAGAWRALNDFVGGLTVSIVWTGKLASAIWDGLVAAFRAISDAASRAHDAVQRLYQKIREAPGKAAGSALSNPIVSLPGALISRVFAGGGVVYAAKGFAARGTDTVPAMLTPGEMVLNAGHQAELFNAIDGGNLGGSIVVNVYGTIRSDQDLVKVIRDAQRRGAFA